MKKNRGNTTIGKELDRLALHKQSSVKQITDVSRLLESPEHKSRIQLMRDLGWNQNITRVETLVGSEKERSELMDKLGHTDVSKLEEIGEQAITYNLKFLPAKQFLCPERCEDRMSMLCDDFLKEKNIANGYVENRFFVLADERYFLRRQLNIDDEIGAHIFYEPPKSNGNYLRVGSIGSGYVSFWRYLNGWRHRDPINGVFHWSVLTFFVSLPLIFLLMPSFGKAFFLSLVAALCAAVAFVHEMRERGGYSVSTWNKPPKYKSPILTR